MPQNSPSFFINPPSFPTPNPTPPTTSPPTPDIVSEPPPPPSEILTPVPPGLPNSPEYVPSPPGTIPSPPEEYMPTPPSVGPSPPEGYVPGPPEGYVPGPPYFLPPVVFPPPAVPPPPYSGSGITLWCVAKPTVPDPIIQEAMNYACGSGADCQSIQPDGSCYEPDTLLSHASLAFNSYWQRTKAAGGTCDFGGIAMLITQDPSFDECRFIYY
ncbi:major pollen allergen Ole e 10-like [Aristolochia californica]|uniref:major pollen allergen Ole e 10-like n=1 Tax=Aristolochia californica TaxID=171875 RepID=UPI0035DA8984